MNNIYIDLRGLEIKELFPDKDIISVEDLIEVMIGIYIDNNNKEEEIESLKEYKEQYCELYDKYCNQEEIVRQKTKTKVLNLRLTDWELAELEKAVNITRQSKSSFIIMAMLEKSQKIKDKGEQNETK